MKIMIIKIEDAGQYAGQDADQDADQDDGQVMLILLAMIRTTIITQY